MPASSDTIKLQLAMAFGQGAGLMIATEEALDSLLSNQFDLIKDAAPRWADLHWPIIELTRLLGKLSAQGAAARRSAVITWQDIEPCLPVIFQLCPCNEKTPPTEKA